MARHKKHYFRETADPIFERAASIGPSSINEADRSFEMVFATDALIGGHRLAITPENVSKATGVSLLDSHNRSSLSNVIGVIGETSIVGNEARARVRMSARADALWQDVKAGIIRGGSVGYVVDEMTNATEGGKQVKIAKRWTPREISLTAVPADPAATIRSQEAIMDQVITTEPAATASTPDPPAAAIVDRAAINTEIRSIAKLTNPPLPQTWIDRQIDANATIEVARAAAFEEMKTRASAGGITRTATASIGGFDANDPDWRIRQIGEVITARMTGLVPPESAQQFKGLPAPELVREIMRVRGQDTTGGSGTIVQRAMMATSDLASVMGDALGKSMRQAFQAVPSALRPLVRQISVPDFRTQHRIQVSAVPPLEKVNESGEFPHVAISDMEETLRLSTYGNIVTLSRQIIANDELAAVADMARRQGIAAAATEAAMLAGIIEDNPAMSDSYNVFDETHHHNLAGSGAALSDTTLSTGRLAMRSQREPSGQLVAAVPRFLLVPAALETLGQKTLTAVQAVETSNVNPFSFLQLVVEPRLADATAYYLVADPAGIDGLVLAYLQGEEGPQAFQEIGFSSDGVSYKIRFDLAVSFDEYRGWYKNPGQ